MTPSAASKVRLHFCRMESGRFAGTPRDLNFRTFYRSESESHRLWETAVAAKELGLDGISFLAADLYTPAFNRSSPWPMSRQGEIGLSLSEIAILENEIEKLISDGASEFGAGFIAESPANSGKLPIISGVSWV